MKLSAVKLANAIRIGANEKSFLSENDYELSLDNGVLIRARQKRPMQSGDRPSATTTIFNTIYFNEAPPEYVDPPRQTNKVSTKTQ